MSNLTPEIADKVLAADERNIVKKVGGEGVMSSTERERIERAAFTNITPEKLFEQRRVSLLIKLARGASLSADQRKEINELLPPSPHLLKHVTRASLKKTLADYAKELGYGERALERWIEAGRSCDPPDLPPFDQGAPGLVEWWKRMKVFGRLKQKVPERLAKLALTAAPAQAAGPSAPSQPGAPTSTDEKPPSKPLQLPEGSGFAAALDRCRDNERIASARLRDAIESQDIGRIEAAQTAWSKAFESLRKAEKDAEQVLLATGELVRWSEVEKEQAEILQSLNQSLRSIFVRVATKVPVPADLYQMLERATQDELDRIFTHLAENDYDARKSQPFQLAA